MKAEYNRLIQEKRNHIKGLRKSQEDVLEFKGTNKAKERYIERAELHIQAFLKEIEELEKEVMPNKTVAGKPVGQPVQGGTNAKKKK